jgi:ribosome-binding ATPase
MKLGIIGFPGAGKSTVFEALTRNVSGGGYGEENRIGTIRVPDERVDRLSAIYNPKKTIYAQVEYFLPGTRHFLPERGKEQGIWTQVRDCDALILVIRNFEAAATPLKDFRRMDQEMILSDLMVVEKRLERVEADKRRGKKVDTEEPQLLERCRVALEQEIPLRRYPELAAAPPLKGFAFVSAKPLLVLFNNAEEDERLPEPDAPPPSVLTEEECMVIRGRIEREIALMSDAEALDFLSEYGISDSAADRVITRSYDRMGLLSFFTVGEDEVRAWTIRKGTAALDAADVIHSDIRKGFIRAEVLAYSDLMEAGGYAEARKRGTVRLEGKTYEVRDGDIVHFRFNV